jgi:hypothetical protein
VWLYDDRRMFMSFRLNQCYCIRVTVLFYYLFLRLFPTGCHDEIQGLHG